MAGAWIRAAALLAMLAACDGTAGLDDAKTIAAAGDTRANADRTIECRPSAEPCANLIRIKADACLSLAQQEIAAARARGAEARRRSDCATENYALALANLDDPSGAIRAGQLEAYRVARQVSPSSTEAEGRNRALATAAAAFTTAFPNRQPGPYYAADAAYWRVSVGAVADTCGALATVGALTKEAAGKRPVAGAPDLSGAIASLDARSARTATREGCAP